MLSAETTSGPAESAASPAGYFQPFPPMEFLHAPGFRLSLPSGAVYSRFAFPHNHKKILRHALCFKCGEGESLRSWRNRMLNGIYVSTAGSLVQSARQEVIANNLANVNTAGFRRQIPIFSRRPPESQDPNSPAANMAPMKLNPLLERIDGGVYMAEIATVHEGGPLTRTSGDYDFAISGEGFFMCEDKSGERFYTRAGNFIPDKNGNLTTTDGKYYLLDASGQRIVSHSRDDISADSIKAVTFESMKSLRRHGENMFTSKDEPVFSAAEIKRNYIEASNVSPIVELISMIEGFRVYEANMQAIRHQDRTLGRAVNDVGRLGR